jgi:hypothetical protein
VALGGLLLCAGGLTLSLVPVLALVVVGLALVTLGNFSAVTAAQLGVAGSTDRDRGVASAMYFSGYYVAGALGAYVPGLAWEQWHWTGVWAMAIAAYALGLAALVATALPSPVRALLRLLHLRTARLLREHRLPALLLPSSGSTRSGASVPDARRRRRALREPRGRPAATGSSTREGELCASCRLTRTRPADDDPRRSSSSAGRGGQALAALRARRAGPAGAELARARGGLAFELLSSERAPVTTGHADGVITLDVAESDDAHREALREQLGEPYRTVLGHFRHEVGHYYWPLLVPDGGARERCRGCSATSARTTARRSSATTRRGRRPTGRSASSAPTRRCTRGRTGQRPSPTTCTSGTRCRPRAPTACVCGDRERRPSGDFGAICWTTGCR